MLILFHQGGSDTSQVPQTVTSTPVARDQTPAQDINTAARLGRRDWQSPQQLGNELASAFATQTVLNNLKIQGSISLTSGGETVILTTRTLTYLDENGDPQQIQVVTAN